MRDVEHVTPPLERGPLRATHTRFGLGGNPIVVIEADSATGDDAEITLDMDEARAVRDWLNRVLP